MADKYQQRLSKTRFVVIVAAFAVAVFLYAVRHALGV